jgi:UDP-N-acetylmuramoyl-tripeptide--D-alanyl-D-alanine ligase
VETFYLKDLVCAVGGKLVKGNPGFSANGVSIDSRTIKKGETYFAVRGARYDGHDFIKEAIDKGAVAVVCSKDKIDSIKSFPDSVSIIKTNDTLISLGEFAKSYRTKFKNIKIAGITGSNGKTTTKEILASILKRKGRTLSNEGNFNNRIGLSLSIFNLTSDIEYAVFEIGASLCGEIKMLSDILKPDAGIVTNVGFSHLGTFVSPEGVFKEKKVLFDNVKETGFIVVNNDDQFLRIVPRYISHKIITFALDAAADVCAKNIKLFPDKIDFEIFYKESSVKITMPAKGIFSVSNALSAAACAIGFGSSLDEIKCGIENFMPPKMRMETLVTRTDIVLINDAYNANPSSVRKAIQAVLQSYGGKKINLVLGDMLELGDKSADYHFQLGKFINAQNISSVYLLGEMSFYTKEALNSKNVFYSKDSDALLTQLGQIPTDGDCVFLFKASRGMRLEKIYTGFLNILEQRNK